MYGLCLDQLVGDPVVTLRFVTAIQDENNALAEKLWKKLFDVVVSIKAFQWSRFGLGLVLAWVYEEGSFLIGLGLVLAWVYEEGSFLIGYSSVGL